MKEDRYGRLVIDQRGIIDGLIEAENDRLHEARKEIWQNHRRYCNVCIGGGDCSGPFVIQGPLNPEDS